jgi:antitoxin MazE
MPARTRNKKIPQQSNNFVITPNHFPMQVSVIRIGNSRGIRFPKSVIDQYGIGGSVELVLEKDRIIIEPLSKPRNGWESAFRTMHEKGEDVLLLPDNLEEENELP